MLPWNPTVFSKNIPKECRDKIAEFHTAVWHALLRPQEFGRLR